MPASLDSLTRERVRLTLTIGDNPENDLYVVYRPYALTPRKVAELDAGIREGESTGRSVSDQTTSLFVEWVAEWNLRVHDDDHDPIPLTPEGLQDVPTAVFATVFRAITADQEPDPTTRKGSGRRS